MCGDVACEPCTGSIWSQRVPGSSRRHQHELGVRGDADRKAGDMAKCEMGPIGVPNFFLPTSSNPDDIQQSRSTAGRSGMLVPAPLHEGAPEERGEERVCARSTGRMGGLSTDSPGRATWRGGR